MVAFIHHAFAPVLVADARAARNVLRVMGTLPSAYPEQASAVLVAEVMNMALSGQVPLPLPLLGAFQETWSNAELIGVRAHATTPQLSTEAICYPSILYFGQGFRAFLGLSGALPFNACERRRCF